MRHISLTIALMLLFPSYILGMSRPTADEITIPHEKYRAVITDVDGVETRGENITFNDQTVVHAKRGSTSVFIPFERIRSIELKNNDQVILRELEEIDMRLVLKDGSDVELVGFSHHEMTGETSFGIFRIRLDRVSRIIILDTDID